MINARCSWLHGDERGFRSRGHRIHSSGDYRNPPPADEHAGLRRYHAARSGKAVSFAFEVRIALLEAFVRKMRKLGFRIIACSISRQHLHAIVELERDYELVKKIVGKCKQYASH